MQARQGIAAKDAAALTLQAALNGSQARQDFAAQDCKIEVPHRLPRMWTDLLTLSQNGYAATEVEI